MQRPSKHRLNKLMLADISKEVQHRLQILSFQYPWPRLALSWPNISSSKAQMVTEITFNL